MDILLGHIFETGFKAGFLWGLESKSVPIENVDFFREKILKKAKELGLKEELLFLKPGQKPFQESLIANLEDQKEETKYLYGSYVIGYYEGYYLALEEVRSGAERISFIETLDTKDEEKGSYHHADLLYTSQDTLYLYELKGRGLYSFLDAFYRKATLTVPYYPSGFQVRFLVGALDFESYIDSILNVLKDRERVDIDIDMKNFLQAAVYLLDYLYWHYDKLKKIKFVKLGVIYALHEWMVYRMHLKNLEALREKAEELKEIYQRTVSKTFTREWLEVEVALLKKEIESLQDRVFEEKEIKIKPVVGILELRNEVRKRMEEVKRRGPGDYYFMHSMGAGKTISAIKTFIQPDEPILFIYIAPRKKLLESAKEEIKKHAEELGLEFYTVSLGKDGVIILTSQNLASGRETEQRTKEGRGREYFRLKGKGFPEITHHVSYQNDESGNLKVIADFLSRFSLEGLNPPKHVIILATMQSFTTTIYHKAVNHLNKLEMDPFSNHSKVIILDEILGAENGLYTIKSIQSISWAKDAIKLYFDASLHSLSVFEKTWKTFKQHGTIPDMLLFVDKDVFVKENPDKGFFSLHSYPASLLTIRSKVIKAGKDWDNLADKLAEDIDSILALMKKQGQRMFVYIQDRVMAMKLSERLRGKGYSVAVYTTYVGASSRAEEEEAVDQGVDVIIATSTLSRGITLSNNFTGVYIVNLHYYNPTRELTEKIQAIARIRGGNTDHMEKVVYDVYVIPDEEKTSQEYYGELKSKIETGSEVIEDINIEYARKKALLRLYKTVLALQEITIRTFHSFINPEEASRLYGYIIVPLCYQEKPVFYPTSISEIQGYIAFVRDIIRYYEDKGEKVYSDCYRSLDALEKFYEFKAQKASEEKFYCPYLLYRARLLEDASQRMFKLLYRCFEKIGPRLEKFTSKRDYCERALESIKNLIIAPRRSSVIPVLEYIPLSALIWEMAKPEEIRYVQLLSSISRAGVRPEFYMFLSDKTFIVKREKDGEARVSGIPVSIESLPSENFPAINYDTLKYLL